MGSINPVYLLLGSMSAGAAFVAVIAFLFLELAMGGAHQPTQRERVAQLETQVRELQAQVQAVAGRCPAP